MEYDPTSWTIQEDPYPTYRWLREERPVYHNDRMGFFALSRFQDVWDATMNPGTFSSAYGLTIEKIESPLPLMITTDPPKHTRIRTLVSRAFTPRRIAELEDTVRAITRERLAGLERGDEVDLFEQLASPMPMDVISTLLGVPPEDRDRVRRLSNQAMERESGTLEVPRSVLEAMGELFVYYQGLMEERRREPQEDLLSDLLRAELRQDDGTTTKLTSEEVLGFCTLLGNAGHETTARLIGNSAVTLARHPDQRRELAADPSLLPNAVEEMLRFDPPSQVQGRWTIREATFHGETIPADVRVLLLTGAAERDEREYDAPDRFDIHRKIERHLSLGYGHHLCLGKSLARQECRVAFEELLARFPDYEIDEATLERAHNNNVRGFARVPMRL
jgi:cytochrome P450